MQTSAPVQYVLAVKFGEGDEGPVAIGSGKRTYRHTETDNLVANGVKLPHIFGVGSKANEG